MKFINQFADLCQLRNGTKIHRINNGNIYSYFIIGTIPQSKALIVAKASAIESTRFIYENDFTENSFIVDSDFDPKEVGQLMINQIKEWSAKEIDNIEASYLEEEYKLKNVKGDIIHLADCVWEKDKKVNTEIMCWFCWCLLVVDGVTRAREEWGLVCFGCC